MSDDEENGGKIIPFPSKKRRSKEKDSPEPVEESRAPIHLTKDNVHRLVKSLSTIHMATTYRASNNESCKENIRKANFPCKLNCACYVNLCAAMGLEAFLGGESQEEAILLVDAEHELIKALYPNLADEDADSED